MHIRTDRKDVSLPIGHTHSREIEQSRCELRDTETPADRSLSEMDLSKSIVAVRSCHSAIQLRRHRKASPVLSILRTPTRKKQAGELDCQGKRTRTNSPLDSIRFQPESACESTDLSRLCVYSDIQFTPTGDEPVIKTYVSVRGASGRTRTDNLLITNQLHSQLCYGSIHSPCGECEQRQLLSKRKDVYCRLRTRKNSRHGAPFRIRT